MRWKERESRQLLSEVAARTLTDFTHRCNRTRNIHHIKNTLSRWWMRFLPDRFSQVSDCSLFFSRDGVSSIIRLILLTHIHAYTCACTYIYHFREVISPAPSPGIITMLSIANVRRVSERAVLDHPDWSDDHSDIALRAVRGWTSDMQRAGLRPIYRHARAHRSFRWFRRSPWYPDNARRQFRCCTSDNAFIPDRDSPSPLRNAVVKYRAG